MTFYGEARRVRNASSPLNVRHTAFRSCVGTFSWLSRESFTSIYQRYNVQFGLDLDNLKTGERLLQALEALEAERNQFLERLHHFETKRVREKMRGCRTPTAVAIEKLYGSSKQV